MKFWEMKTRERINLRKGSGWVVAVVVVVAHTRVHKHVRTHLLRTHGASLLPAKTFLIQ